MSDFLHRFSYQYREFNAATATCMILVWLAVLACTISSILAQSFPPGPRAFWVVLVLCLPLLGVLAYLPYSFKKDDLAQFFLTKPKKNKRRKPVTGKAASDKR